MWPTKAFAFMFMEANGWPFTITFLEEDLVDRQE
jgi:hypothetical protein